MAIYILYESGQLKQNIFAVGYDTMFIQYFNVLWWNFFLYKKNVNNNFN